MKSLKNRYWEYLLDSKEINLSEVLQRLKEEESSSILNYTEYICQIEKDVPRSFSEHIDTKDRVEYEIILRKVLQTIMYYHSIGYCQVRI